MKTVLITIAALLHFNPLIAVDVVEYGSLRTYPAGTNSKIITLNDGDVMYVLSQNIDEMKNRSDSNGLWGLIVVYDPGSAKEYTKNFDRIISESERTRHIVGPATVQLRYQWSTPSSLWYVNYKLTRGSQVDYKQANILTLPSGVVGAGTHEIVVEASDDLQTWTPVHSSTIDGNNAFFRTRVITPTVPDISNYYTKDEVGSLIESNLTNAISLGQQDVTGNPSQYNLFTSSDLSDAQSSSRTAGQQDVISSPSDYDLMGAEGVLDMRVSQPGISTNGDKASMNFTIQSSNDLEEWSNEETIQREYTMPSDKNFMRVSVGPEIEPEPEPLPAITTDTYGDRLVYDESNNLYVNDENTPLMKDGLNLRTDTYANWNFYAIESTDSGYICILKNVTRFREFTFDPNGNYISGKVDINLSAYESLLGQSLN
jgi:hypothetical protein